MKKLLFPSFLAGLLFGLGLAVSNMINPQRVLSFLDIFGVWDPTLAMVMGGALSVTIPGFYLVLKRKKPVCSSEFTLPTKTHIDSKLTVGAILFGIGWGLSGLCPGPAVAALVSLDMNLVLFVVLMILGWLVADKLVCNPPEK